MLCLSSDSSISSVRSTLKCSLRLLFLSLLHSPTSKDQQKRLWSFFPPLLESEKINVYAKTCEDSHTICWEAGKGWTLHLNCPISPQEALNPDGSLSQTKRFSYSKNLSFLCFPIWSIRQICLAFKHTCFQGIIHSFKPDSSANLGSTGLTLQAG